MSTSRLAQRPARLLANRNRLLTGLLLGLGVLMGVLLLSIVVGAVAVDLSTIWKSLTAYDSTVTDEAIIRSLRIPRAAVAGLVGAALAVAGALIQGVTRNPIADPGILGINAGAAFAVILALFLTGANSVHAYALYAFLGAGLTAATVYGLSALSEGGPTPLTLTIAGAAITALLSSLTTVILLADDRTLDEVRFWLAGSVAGRDMNLLLQIAPYLLGSLLLAFALGPQITALALGDDVARGLGQNVGLVKATAALAVVLLSGSSVAVAGPIAFVGLVIPHVVRFGVGVDYRWVLPYSAIAGACFLILADLAARVVLNPWELPVGVMTALIGGPVLIALVRRHVTR